MSDQLIPGPDPGACPKCGQWLKAGMLHECPKPPVPPPALLRRSPLLFFLAARGRSHD